MKELDQGRRQALKAVGFAAIAAGVSVASPAFAAEKMSPTNIQLTPDILQLPLSDPRAIEALKLNSPLPDSTPITKLGLTARGVAMLSPAAKNVTKGDLIALAEGKTTSTTARLTVQDFRSVIGAFSVGLTNSDIHISCCCCCCA